MTFNGLLGAFSHIFPSYWRDRGHRLAGTRMVGWPSPRSSPVRPRQVKSEQRATFLAVLRTAARWITSQHRHGARDDQFLVCAITGGCTSLVTGDNGLLGWPVVPHWRR